MKKFSKFLLTIPTAAVAVTPIVVTSCGSNYEEIIEMVELDGVKTPTFAQYSGTEALNLTEATNIYIDHMKDNHDDFKQDMIYGASLGYEKFASVGNLKSFKVGIGSPIFGKTTVWEFGFEPTPMNTISFKKKMDIVYQYTDANTGMEETTHIDITIDYQDVIFTTHEHFKGNDATDKSGWAAGIIDESVGDEAYWTHQFNESPWSVSYSAVYEKIRKYKTPEGQPDIEIKNCHYYSGLLDDTAKLYNLWWYRQNNVEHPDLDPKIARIENEFIDQILLFGNVSYYMELSQNIPDVCLIEPLYTSDYKLPVVEGEREVKLNGVKFINTFDEKCSNAKFTITVGFPLACDEITSDPNPRTLTIPAHGEFTQLDGGSGMGMDGVKLSRGYDFDTEEAYKSFNINLKYFHGTLSYDKQNENGEVVRVNQPTDLYLHYNSITLKFIN